MTSPDTLAQMLRACLERYPKALQADGGQAVTMPHVIDALAALDSLLAQAREAATLREALETARERIRTNMLATKTTEANDTRDDGYAAGLLAAIYALDEALAAAAPAETAR